MSADVRQAFRVLWRTPRFTLLAIAVLALGLAANAAVFSLVAALLFRPLLIDDPDRLRFLFLTDPAVPNFQGSLAYRDYLILQERNSTFTALAARVTDTGHLKLPSDVVQVRGEAVTGNYFQVLGVQPAVGRPFDAGSETAPAAPLTIVLSHRLWQSRFNGDPGVLGTPVVLDGAAYTVIGIMPAGFTGTISSWEPAEYWTALLPRALSRRCATPNLADGIGVSVIGRLKPDANDADARKMLSAEDLRFRPVSLPAHARPSTAMWAVEASDSVHQRLPFDSSGRVVPARLAGALLTVSGLVLLVGIANLTGLLSARTISRRSEIAIRSTLGATSWRISRQLIAEGLLVGLAGALLALLLTPWLLHGIVRFLPNQVASGVIGYAQPVAIQPLVDVRLGVFVIALSLVAGVLIGIAPLRMASRTGSLAYVAGEETIGTSPVRARLQYMNIVPQICVALVLLIGASTLAREAIAYVITNPGYDPRGLVFVEFSLPTPCRDEAPERRLAWTRERDLLHERIIQRARRTGQFSAADLTSVLPFVSPRAGRAMVVARPDAQDARVYHATSHTWVTPGYFRTMGIPLLAGREFREDDRQKPRRVAIVCSALARRLWGDRNPVGQALAFHEPSSPSPPQWVEVVGVVGEVTAPGALNDNPIVYTPLASGDWALAVVTRTTAPPAESIALLRHAMTEVDPGIQLWRSSTMQEAAEQLQYPQRFGAAVMTIAGLVTLVLASIGLYGTVSYAVAQRTREIGVRTALGAEPRDILILFGRDGAVMVAAACALGVALAYTIVKVVSTLVTPLPPIDPLAALGVIVFVTAVVLLACYVPARRATRTDPIAALRSL